MAEKDTILINIMYNGSYLNKYIGHEVINLKKADNDQHYIYVNPYGDVNSKYYKRIKYLLLARRSGYANTLEIMAIAYNLEPCIDFEKIKEEYEETKIDLNLITSKYKSRPRQNTITKLNKIMDRIKNDKYKKLNLDNDIINYIKKRIECLINQETLPNEWIENKIDKNFKIIKKAFNKQNDDIRGKIIHKYQMDYINKITDLKYDNKDLEKIFAENDGNEYSIYTTYHAKGFIRLKEPLYITDTTVKDKDTKYSSIERYNINEKLKQEEPINFSKYSLKMYFSKDYKKLAYEYLNGLIEDKLKEAKDDKNSTVIKTPQVEKIKINKNKRFFEIIGQEYNELAFSNLFQYIFGKKARKTFKNFVKKYLELDLHDNFQIERERNHVDLLVSDGSNLIIIENKIKSDINGTQLEDYCYLTNGMKKDKNNNYIKDDNLKLKYEKYKDENKRFCLFAPNYNHIKESLTISCKIDEDEKNTYNYKLIEYSDIRDYFQNNYEENDGKIDDYYNEFLNAIERHSHDVDNIQERQMFERFAERIAELDNPTSESDGVA